MVRCQKFTCNRKQVPGEGITFHRIPKEPPEVVEAWMRFCDYPTRVVRVPQTRPDGVFVLVPTEMPWDFPLGSLVCGRHFKKFDYEGTKKLKPLAVPSIEAEASATRGDWRTNPVGRHLRHRARPVKDAKFGEAWVNLNPRAFTSTSSTACTSEIVQTTRRTVTVRGAEEGAGSSTAAVEVEGYSTEVEESGPAAVNNHVETSQHPCDSKDEDTLYCNVHVKREPVDEDTMEFATDQSSNNSNQSSNDNRTGQHEWPWIKEEQDTDVISCTVKSERLSESGDYDNGSQTLQLTCWDSSPESEVNCESSIVKHSNAEIRNALAIIRRTIHLNGLTECIVPLQTIETAFKKSIFQ